MIFARLVSVTALMCQERRVGEYRVLLPSSLMLLPSWSMVYDAAATALQPLP